MFREGEFSVFWGVSTFQGDPFGKGRFLATFDSIFWAKILKFLTFHRGRGKLHGIICRNFNFCKKRFGQENSSIKFCFGLMGGELILIFLEGDFFPNRNLSLGDAFFP